MLKTKLWAACMALVLANLAILFYVYGNVTTGEQKVAAQNINRLISTYAEPESNPVLLVRAEDRCRFYGKLYCPTAKQRRVAAVAPFTNPIQLSEEAMSSLPYIDYLNARSDLLSATAEYTAILDSEPTLPEYLAASLAYEAKAGASVGVIVANLYTLQDEALRESEKSGNLAFTLGYVCNILLIAIMVFARRAYPPKRN